jgi:hypothetical protein
LNLLFMNFQNYFLFLDVSCYFVDIKEDVILVLAFICELYFCQIRKIQFKLFVYCNFTIIFKYTEYSA